MSSNPISYGDIKAYGDLMRVSMTPFEVDTIRRVDSAILAKQAEKHEKEKATPSTAKPAAPRVVKADDVEGAKAFFSSFGKART